MNKFSINCFEPDKKGRLIVSKRLQQIVKELRKKFNLKKLISHKGHPINWGLWETVNEDLAKFSEQYPEVLFEVRRLEFADVNGEPKTLITVINALNSSINVLTFSGDPDEKGRLKTVKLGGEVQDNSVA